MRSNGQIANFGKKSSNLFNYYKRITEKERPILKNLNNFTPDAFYSNPLQLENKRKRIIDINLFIKNLFIQSSWY